MFYTIYKTTNLLNGKYYIGKHQTYDPNDDYLGSGNLLKRAIKKYGRNNFKKEILHIFDNEADMNTKEKELVVIHEDSYNLCDGGHGGWGYVNREGNPNRKFSNPREAGIRGQKLFTSNPERLLSRNGNISIGLRKRFETHAHHSLGLKHSAKTKAQISLSQQGKHDGILNSQFGTIWITNGFSCKKIEKEELDNYIQLGYIRGRKTQ